MKIPKSLLIKGKRWTVPRVKKVTNENGELLQGQYLYPDRVILLDRELTGEELVITFWHELLHVILKESHIADNFEMPEVIEDILCDAIAYVLNDYTILKPQRGKR